MSFLVQIVEGLKNTHFFVKNILTHLSLRVFIDKFLVLFITETLASVTILRLYLKHDASLNLLSSDKLSL